MPGLDMMLAKLLGLIYSSFEELALLDKIYGCVAIITWIASRLDYMTGYQDVYRWPQEWLLGNKLHCSDSSKFYPTSKYIQSSYYFQKCELWLSWETSNACVWLWLNTLFLFCNFTKCHPFWKSAWMAIYKYALYFPLAGWHQFKYVCCS